MMRSILAYRAACGCKLAHLQPMSDECGDVTDVAQMRKHPALRLRHQSALEKGILAALGKSTNRCAVSSVTLARRKVGGEDLVQEGVSVSPKNWRCAWKH